MIKAYHAGLFSFLPSSNDLRIITVSLGSCPSGMKQVQQAQCSSWRLSVPCGAERDLLTHNCSTSSDGNQSFGHNT